MMEDKIMDKNKFFKGHFKANCDFQSADGKHFIRFGDEFDVTDVLKDNRVEIKHNDETFLFEGNSFDGSFFPFEKS